MNDKHKTTKHERYLHFNRRMMERYGISAEEQDYDDLQYLFSCGYYKYIKRCRGGDDSHYIMIEFKQTPVYFIVNESQITTVVTKNQVNENTCKTHKDMIKNSKKEKKNRQTLDRKRIGNRKNAGLQKQVKDKKKYVH